MTFELFVTGYIPRKWMTIIRRLSPSITILYFSLYEFCRLGGSGTVSLADFAFLITLLKTANKYNFQSLQDCVINQLVLHCCPKQGTDLTKWSSPLDRMPLPELERLLHLAVVINHVELCKAVQNSWFMQRRKLNTPTP